MAAITAFMAAGVLFAWLYGIHDRAADVNPSPISGAIEAGETDDGFPAVDWEYWLSVNPDIVAWVTVPGTDIDHPVVQARPYDPTFYLTHDVYRDWNPYGCPYPDAGCADLGIDSPVALMFAHHMNDGSMFSALASYSDASFAQAHGEILLQTPEEKIRLGVVAVDVVVRTEKASGWSSRATRSSTPGSRDCLPKRTSSSTGMRKRAASRRSAPAATVAGTAMSGLSSTQCHISTSASKLNLRTGM